MSSSALAVPSKAYLEHFEAVVAEMRDHLTILESGRYKFHSSGPNDIGSRDVTQEVVARHKHNVEELEQLLATAHSAV